MQELCSKLRSMVKGSGAGENATAKKFSSIFNRCVEGMFAMKQLNEEPDYQKWIDELLYLAS